MIIPPIRWGDILLRSTTRRSVSLSEREQYLLYMLLSWVQLNPSIMLSDYVDYDPATVNQFIDECMNSLINETTPPYEAHAMYPITLFVADCLVVAGTWSRTNHDSFFLRQYFGNTNVSSGALRGFVYLTAGTWKCRLRYAKSSTSGIWYIRLEDSIGNIDISTGLNLNGSASVENILDVTLTIPRTGRYELEIYNQGATTSGGHRGEFTCFHFWQE